MSDEVKLLPCALERLAEHLAARVKPDTIEEVVDWLNYSLNRCGLVVVEEQSLTRAIEATRPTDEEWQPIESAPFDRMFLAAIYHGKSYVVCQARRTKAGVFDTMEDSCVGWRPHPAYKPAYWQPLPDPPAQQVNHD